MLSSGMATLLHLVVLVLFLVVALVYVRPNRPDVWPLVAGWAGGSVLVMIASVVTSSVVPSLVAQTSGTDGVIAAMGIVSVTFALLRAGLDCVLAYAIMLLARGKRDDGARPTLG
jgi:hypothetical protein